MFKKSNVAKIIPVVTALVFMALPAVMVMAQNGGSTAVPTANSYTTPSLWPTGYWGQGGLISCTGNYLASNTGPQCTSLCDLINTFVNIVYFLMSIAIFIIAPVMLVVGGVMMMLSGANPGMLETGKKVLTGTVIGLVIVLCSYLLISTLLKVLGVTAIGGFGGPTCTPD